jgi:hypothetical protein
MLRGAVAVFEGITLNRASELLYGTEATTDQRNSDTLLYVRCLEDVVFGIVFGGSIATGKVAQVAPNVSPFKDLTKDLSLSVREVDAHGLTETELLEESDELDKLRDMIRGLDEAIQRDDSGAWNSLAYRELKGSLSDPALRIDLDDPSKYVFAGRANFWPHRELQELVPGKFLKEILNTLRSNLDLPAGVCDNAVRAFISRMVLAHLLIFRTYQRAFRTQYRNTAAFHVPYATRASVVPKLGNAIWTVRRCVVPRVILKIIDDSETRGDFRESLGHNSVSTLYNKHRELFSEALAYQAEGKTAEADQIIVALRRLSMGEPADTVRVGNMTASHHLNSLPIAVRKELIANQYHASLKRVFPELRFGRERGLLAAQQEVMTPTQVKNKVFVSYSHKDKKFLEDLLVHLKPLERKGRVTTWSDKQIKPGDKWFDEIKQALASSKVAVLLLTSHFLASDFIHEHELGPVLKEAEAGGVKILWILVRACSYQETALKDYQSVFRLTKPLAEMKAERDSAWVQICEEIKKAVG